MEFEKITQHIIIGIKEEFEFQMKLIYLKGLKWAENKQWLSPLAHICTYANRSFIQVDVGISYVSIASAGFEQRTAGWVMWQRMMWMAITVSMNEYASPARTPVRDLSLSLFLFFSTQDREMRQTALCVVAINLRSWLCLTLRHFVA